MSVWAILPVRQYDEPQTDASGASLEDKLLLLRHVQKISTIVVMSPDAKVVQIARQFGVHTISIADLPAWETGLSRALYLAAAAGKRRAMVLNPALPLSDAFFLDRLIEQDQPTFSLMLAPMDDGASTAPNGDTGIALVSPPDYLPIALGAGSLQHNIKAALTVHALLTMVSIEHHTAITQ